MKKRIIYLIFIIVLLVNISCGSKTYENIIKPDKNIFKDTMVEMTWPEVKKAVENSSIVIFPIAVVEEHGPHMDLSPDIYLTTYFCRMLKQELEKKEINSVIAPPSYWGITNDVERFPGSFNLREETFKALLVDSSKCIKNWGFTKIFFVNFHGDRTHNRVLDSSIAEIHNTLGLDAYNLMPLIVSTGNNKTRLPRPRPEKFRPDYHAGADETAYIWALHPEKVREKEIEKLKPQSSFQDPLGYVGDPASYKLDKEFIVELYKVFLKDGADAIESVLPKKKK
jgi:creatinine amidohydrolase